MTNETRAWMVRHGRTGEHEELALTTGHAVLGWQNVGSLARLRSKNRIRELVAKSEPDLNTHQIGQATGQLFAFAVDMKENDVIVLPMKSATDQIRVGRVKGPYEYTSPTAEEGSEPRHTRRVEWRSDPLYRSDLQSDLQLSLKTMRTVCKLSKFDGYRRWNELALGQRDPLVVDAKTLETEDDLSDLDIGEITRQQIADHVLRMFDGAKMERLVAEVLKAVGYHVYKTKASGDWGVDVLAGSGPLGFDSPRMVVQVKAQRGETGAAPIRELEGAREKFGADQALFLCWGGYTEPAKQEASLSYFSMRLWDAYDFIDVLCRHYERLPLDIRDAIPLQYTWALVRTGEV